jgi:hypothetical protein
MAISSAVKSTGSKVEQGDTVTVPVSAIGLINAGDAKAIADLGKFMGGFLQTTVKVQNVIPDGAGNAIGSVVGLAPPVKFSLAAVTSITRNGSTFT